MKGHLKLFSFLSLLSFAAVSQAATVQYSDRTTFLGQLSAAITDGYDAPGYTMGDAGDSAFDDSFTDAAMSAVLGETEYTETQWLASHYVHNQAVDAVYCAGCNGSFLLDFTSTSMGDADGVFGVGIDVVDSYNTYAHVTFGNGSSIDVLMPSAGNFWGITSDLSISSVHFGGIGGIGGAATNDMYLVIDDLTIGAAVVPVPAAVWLFVSGLIGLLGIARHERAAIIPAGE